MLLPSTRTVNLLSARCAMLCAGWLLALILLELAGHHVSRSQFESVGIAFGVFALLAATLRIRRDTSGDAKPAKIAAILPLIPALIAAGTFWWALGLGPLSDDVVIRMWAHDGTWKSIQWDYFRPLPIAVWRLAFYIGAGWPLLHAVNIACHAGTAALLTLIGMKRLTSQAAAVTAGLSFVLFPASLEAVAWTAGVFDCLTTVSVMGAATLFLLSNNSGRDIAVLVGLTAVALLSKESAVMLPLLMLCLIPLAPHVDRPGVRRRAAAILAVSAVVAIYLVGRSAALGQMLASLMPETRWQVKNVLIRPFAALTMPFHSSVPSRLSLMAAVSLIVLFVVALYPRPARPGPDRGPAAIVAGLAWVLLTAIPLLVHFYVAPDLQGSRYAYLPMAGFALAIAGAVESSQTSRVRHVAPAAVCVLFLTWITVWPVHVAPWNAAAALRERILMQAQGLITSHGCTSLDIRHAPDNLQGAYVFRVGLDVFLRTLTYDARGQSCVAEWQLGSLVLASDPTRR